MAYGSIDDGERNAEKAARREAVNASVKRDERSGDAADVGADGQEQDAARWGEGAPACLAAVAFAERMQRRLQAQARDGHAQVYAGAEADGDDSSVAGREHLAEQR